MLVKGSMSSREILQGRGCGRAQSPATSCRASREGPSTLSQAELEPGPPQQQSDVVKKWRRSRSRHQPLQEFLL
jgi:hypothetical protein